jgi:hypothetical protein
MAMLFFCALTYLKIYCRLPRHLNLNLTLEDLEEQEDIRLYRAAKNEKQTFFEAEEVFKDIEESRGENV